MTPTVESFAQFVDDIVELSHRYAFAPLPEVSQVRKNVIKIPIHKPFIKKKKGRTPTRTYSQKTCAAHQRVHKRCNQNWECISLLLSEQQQN